MTQPPPPQVTVLDQLIAKFGPQWPHLLVPSYRTQRNDLYKIRSRVASGRITDTLLLETELAQLFLASNEADQEEFKLKQDLFMQEYHQLQSKSSSPNTQQDEIKESVDRERFRNSMRLSFYLRNLKHELRMQLIEQIRQIAPHAVCDISGSPAYVQIQYTKLESSDMIQLLSWAKERDPSFLPSDS